MYYFITNDLILYYTQVSQIGPVLERQPDTPVLRVSGAGPKRTHFYGLQCTLYLYSEYLTIHLTYIIDSFHYINNVNN